MFLFCSFKGKSQPGWQKARKTGVFDGRAADATHARECDEPVSAGSRHQPQMCRLGEACHIMHCREGSGVMRPISLHFRRCGSQ
jgi:hypothetical protein